MKQYPRQESAVSRQVVPGKVGFLLAVDDAKGKARSVEERSGNLPTAQERLQPVIRNLHRKIPHIVGGELVSQIVIRRSVAGIRVGRINLVQDAVEFAVG